MQRLAAAAELRDPETATPPRAHEPLQRAASARLAGMDEPAMPRSSGWRRRCTTSARSASPTRCCSRPACSTTPTGRSWRTHTEIGRRILEGSAVPPDPGAARSSPTPTTSATTAPGTRSACAGEDDPHRGPHRRHRRRLRRPHDRPAVQAGVLPRRGLRADGGGAGPPLRPVAPRSVPRSAKAIAEIRDRYTEPPDHPAGDRRPSSAVA